MLMSVVQVHLRPPDTKPRSAQALRGFFFVCCTAQMRRVLPLLFGDVGFAAIVLIGFTAALGIGNALRHA